MESNNKPVYKLNTEQLLWTLFTSAVFGYLIALLIVCLVVGQTKIDAAVSIPWRLVLSLPVWVSFIWDWTRIRNS